MTKRIVFLVMIMWLCVPNGYAQVSTSDTIEVTILNFHKPLKWSVLPTVWFYGGASGYLPSKYWKPLPDNKNKIYNNSIVGGIQTELILHNYESSSTASTYTLRVGTNIGYRYQQMSVHPLIYDQAGVNMHWLTMDVYASLWYLMIGFYTDVLLQHNIYNPDHYTYSGIYDDCIERVVPGFVFGIQMPFPVIRFDVRVHVGLYPCLNTPKLSEYNSTTVGFSNQMNIEARIGVPLFIMANKNKMADISLGTLNK